MADDREKRVEAERVRQAERDEAGCGRRERPKTVTRAPADKMARPGLTRGYRTK